jgi:hypothetical protein
MRTKTAAIILLIAAIECGVAQVGIDRSFYQEPDAKDWPGDALSEAQFDKALKHFAVPNVCNSLGHWALIGPKDFLMKGTTWHVWIAGTYINMSHGYWGGDTYEEPLDSLGGVMRLAEHLAKENCMHGRPEGVNSAHHVIDPTAP